MTVGMDSENDPGTAEAALFSQYHQFSEYLRDYASSTNTPHETVSSAVSVGVCELGGVGVVQSGNQLIDKSVTVLAHLLTQIHHINDVILDTYIPAILLYGQDVQDEVFSFENLVKSRFMHFDKVDDVLDDSGGNMVMISGILPCLQELSVYITRAYDLILNVVRQFSAVTGLFTANELQLDYLLDDVGDLLSTLLKVDDVIAKHPLLVSHWNNYMKTLQMIPNNPDKFSLNRVDVHSLERVLQQLSNLIITGFIMQNAVEMPFDCSEQNVTENRKLMDIFSAAIRRLLDKWERDIDRGESDSKPLMRIVCLTVLHNSIYRVVDKKLIKAVWNSYKKVPCFYLIADIVWTPCEFLLSKISELDKMFDRKSRQAVLLYRASIFEQKLQKFIKDSEAETRTVKDWQSRMKNISEGWTEENELVSKYNIINKGVKLASLIGGKARFVLNSHKLEAKESMSKATANALFNAIIQLKSIEITLRSRWLTMLDIRHHIVQMLSRELLKVVNSASTTIKNKKKAELLADVSCALNIVQQALSNAVTPEKCALIRAAFTFIDMKPLTNDQQILILDLWKRLQGALMLEDRIRNTCECAFMMWHTNLLPTYFASILNEQSTEMHANVKLFFCGLEDIVNYGKNSHHENAGRVMNFVSNDLYEKFKQSLMDPLCEILETDLRLSMHGHLQLDDRSPFGTQSTLNPHSPLSLLVNLPPLRLYNMVIHVNQYLERYLEKTFYNLTTVALQDWKSYSEMRQLAKSKYGLTPVDPDLPCQTLEQGLDLLEIMRNIRVFVANYCYNLNAQFFIERDSKNRSLDTLSIHHVANSIRTHGTGIMNTTVNYVYQFLRHHLRIFNQFLFDEQIKSRLFKDVKHFTDNKQQYDGMYPYERAEKFNRGIRKLGVVDGKSCLDNLRILITEIGNALGYVRLVRAGGLESCSHAISFIPDMEDIVSLADYCPSQTILHNTADSFDNAIQSLVTNFDEGTEYFKLLVDTFAPNCRNKQLLHLHTFFVIVPPLMVNYMEYMINCKAKVGKRNQQIQATFTEDGFAMGVAFLLKILDQYDEFDSLQWFKSVQNHYSKAKADLKRKLKAATASKGDKTLAQTLTFSLQTLHTYQKEFDLVLFAVRSARIFLRSDMGSEIIPKDKDIPGSDKDSIASSVKSVIQL